MSPPLSILWRMESFNDLGLHWVENTPDELEAATKEMLERTAVGKNSNYTEDDLQIKFKAIAEACGKNYGKWHGKAFATLSRDFLERHADLL